MMWRLIACLFLFLGAAQSALATEYLSMIPDMPLPVGLAEEVDKGAVFDAPTGRIATGYASGSVAAVAVRAFYDQTLPQLGWETVTQGTYRRQSETLKIDVLGGENGDASIVSYTLSAESQ